MSKNTREQGVDISVTELNNTTSPDSNYQKKVAMSLEQTPANKQMSSFSVPTRIT